jgi:hypothetical protein
MENTLRVALMSRNCGAQVVLNTLTLYNETKLQRDLAKRIERDETKAMLMLDVPELVEKNEYAQVNPHLFPFHSRYVPNAEWTSFVSTTHCLFTLFLCYPRTLETLWIETDTSPLDVANKVMSIVGDLSVIEKPLRRDAELATIISIMEKLTKSRKSRALLESESSSLLN